ncbi:MAG: protein-disulfide reductase DsbD domain-containing protein [Pseudomonadota bacterium]
MIRNMLLSAATALSVGLSLSGPARAQEFDHIKSVINVSFLQGWRHESGAHYAALKVELAPGWKTYWRAPGDGGLPTLMSWEGSQNLARAQILWPRPSVFREGGMRSIGYDTEVVLPIRFLPVTGDDIYAALRLRMGVCKEVCLPVDLKLSTKLDRKATQNVALIRSALDARPDKIEAKLTCRLTRKDGAYLVSVTATVPPLEGRSEASVIELDDPMVWVSEPAFQRSGDTVMAKAQLIPQAKSSTIDLTRLRFTLLSTSDAVEMRGCG